MTAPGAAKVEAPPPSPEPEPAPAAPAEPARKRPVMAPGTQVVAPPPKAEPEESAAKAAAPVAAEPEAPAEFQGLSSVNVQAAVERGPVLLPAESRTSKRVGDLQFTFSVKPGRPIAGESVELVWKIQEILHIPDPFLGDRKPAAPAKLVVTISGPEKARTFEVHALEQPGTWGMHFTPRANGAYLVQIERADGKPGYKTQFDAFIGVAPPSDASARRGGVNDRAEELIPARAPDDRSLDGVMSELGKRWMALERAAGTPDAERALAQVQEQVAKVAGKAPGNAAGHAADFDQLAKLLADRTGALTAGANRTTTLDALQSVQADACMRCHTQFRFGLASSVRSWPQFEVSADPKRPAPAARDASPKRGRGPIAPRQ
ncbi:hypothetical protein AKJ08_0389 [Vulgatibacter incomptus]|uniref:Cytochrome c domain-containing protein n=1 Tax=Vulgatibacter incomptus TaxID=1391653 RepID=A0A0K1P918_9BACT|nr:hypothetical protein AKJ08_0389 [Vulgatibacter incomptus]